MKIAFIWNFIKAPEVYPHWRDGLRAAIEIISKIHQVDVFLGEEYLKVKDDYDFLLFWSDSNDPIIRKFTNFKGRKGLILTSDLGLNLENLKNYDVIYCESSPVYERIRANGFYGLKGMATDTAFYIPNEKLEKIISYFYPATFSPWKRQDLLAFLGSNLYCIGTIQPDGKEIWERCKEAGVHLFEGYFPAEEILWMYQQAEQVIIPAIHGSERTVLEAMSCNILPQVTPENKRTFSYIQEFFTWLGVNQGKWTRDFVLKNYSEQKYAELILKGINV